jgi:putative nucleotidyltransferase with HDIG domain
VDGFSLEQLWQHSEQTAAAARAIALSENLSSAKADEAFLAGVLHDVGKVIFATKAAARPYATSAVDIVAQMEAHHAEVGAYLLGLWGFPNSIVEAVAFHHTPRQASEEGFGLAGIVHVADRLVHLRSENRLAATDTGLQPGYLESLGLDHCLPKWSAAVESLVDRKAAA